MTTPDWREDAKAFLQSCRELGIPAALEISRSGNGAHAWIFFAEPVPAREARLLGAALISHTCQRTRQLSLTSYDRLFPNQDTIPKGGFGNLIALPLQKQPRESGHSVFVDEQLQPHPDQWAFLASIRPMSRQNLEDANLRVTRGHHPLDVAFAIAEEDRKPWQRPSPVPARMAGPLPESLTLVLANQIFIAKSELPQPLSNRLIRLAAFQNPEFYKAQTMRLPVWNKPRIIGCAENFPEHIGLPRGCLDAVLDLLHERTPAPGTRRQARCAHLRLCRDRSAPARPHVGQTPAWLPGHGVRDQTDGDHSFSKGHEPKIRRATTLGLRFHLQQKPPDRYRMNGAETHGDGFIGAPGNDGPLRHHSSTMALARGSSLFLASEAQT